VRPDPGAPLPFDPDVADDARGTQRAPRFAPATIAAVAVGGALGAAARYGVAEAIDDGGKFPWSTFAVNVSGSFALGVVLVFVLERWPPTTYVRPFVATGFLGAYTTFSTIAVEGNLLVRDGRPLLAIAAWALTLLVGIAAAFAGILVARRGAVAA
jgi:CrcB protein